MSISRILKFFLGNITFFNLIQVLINFLLIFLIILAELLFLSAFFLLLNQFSDSQIFSIFFNFLEKNLPYFVDSYSLTEIYILILIFFLIFKNLLTIFQQYFYSKFIHKIAAEKSSEVLNFYMSKNFESFSKKELSTYTKQIIRDVENVFLGIFGLIISFIGELIYVLVLLIYSSYLVDFKFSTSIFVLLMIIVSALYYLYEKAKTLGQIRALNEINVFKSLMDTLNLFKEIKISGNAKEFVKRYKYFLDKFYTTKVFSGLINITPRFIFELFVLVFFFLVYKTESNQLNISEFMLKYSVFVLAIVRLIPSFSRLSTYSSSILYNLHSIKFIEKDFSKKEKKENKYIKKISIKNIQLKGVGLKFLNNKNIESKSNLKNFNYIFKKNNIYGVYGESGTGKTSLLNILAGFIKPSKGTIKFNNNIQDSNEILKNFKLGYCSQSPTILNESILFNLTLKYENSLNDLLTLKKYLKIFNLNKFTNKKYFMMNSSKTISNMSGGEKQRIGFIRSLMNGPDLILLDEPTSALDKKNEKRILKFLKSIKKNKIIIVVSHKEDQKKYFDEIINL
ncbi:ATP-binding cassette domain-containing protein [Candidatus Pelagibacter sp.]|nr:ATP-binding cassette domain-containing protein [Candidatus Pelagibacter sp.]